MQVLHDATLTKSQGVGGHSMYSIILRIVKLTTRCLRRPQSKYVRYLPRYTFSSKLARSQSSSLILTPSYYLAPLHVGYEKSKCGRSFDCVTRRCGSFNKLCGQFSNAGALACAISFIRF